MKEAQIMGQEKRYRYTYVMELEGNGYSYYIGHTSKSQEDIMKEHLQGGRSLTRDNKPLKIIEWIPLGLIDSSLALKQNEQKIIEYMEQYGFLEVRSEKYCIKDFNGHTNLLKGAILNDKLHRYDKIRKQMKAYPDIKIYFEEWDKIKPSTK